MVTPELIKYIQESLPTTPSEKLRQSLIDSGWDPADVDLALNQVPAIQETAIPAKPKRYFTPLILIALLIIISGGVAFAAYNYHQKVDVVAVASPTPEPIASATSTPLQATPLATLTTATATPSSAPVSSTINTDISTWKTYITTGNGFGKGFSFKYPANYSVRKGEGSETMFALQIYNTTKQYSAPGSTLEPIYISYGKDTFGSFDAFISDQADYYQPFTKKPTTPIGGKPAYLLQGKDGAVHFDIRLVFDKGVRYQFRNFATDIHLQLGYPTADQDQINTIFDKVLSSFTFN